MNALLICPGERPAVSLLAEDCPLATLPILGQGLVEYWLAHLANSGAKSVLILANDRPDLVREAVGTGSRWGLSAHVLSEDHELSVSEALLRYPQAVAHENQVHVLSRLPGALHTGLFKDYSTWFAAVEAWMPKAITPERVGIREVQTGLYVGMNTQLASDAEIQPPCWIGNDVIIGAGCRIGPHAVVENGAIIEANTTVAASFVGAETYVGRQTDVHLSIALGDLLINWRHNTHLRITDPFILSSLRRRTKRTGFSHWFRTTLGLRPPSEPVKESETRRAAVST